MKQSVSRPIRTAGQLAPAAVVTELLDSLVHNFNDRQYAAILAGFTLLFSYVQNFIEERKSGATPEG